MWIIGLTGAIGAGKSLVSSYFRHEGIPVHCSDEFVHFLFEKDDDVRKRINQLWPDVFVNGKIDRSLLREHVLSSPRDLSLLENLLYPKLAENQKNFIKKNHQLKRRIVVLDIPLLFEVGLDAYCHRVILVSASSRLRERRVMGRTGMTPQKFHTMEALQIKERDKRKKADFIIVSGRDKGNVLKAIKRVSLLLSQQPIPKWQGRWPKNLKRRTYESKSCFRHRNNGI